jgi:hypothetical protein
MVSLRPSSRAKYNSTPRALDDLGNRRIRSSFVSGKVSGAFFQFRKTGRRLEPSFR